MFEVIARNGVLALIGATIAVIFAVMVLHYRVAARARTRRRQRGQPDHGEGLTPWHVAAVSASQIILLGVGAVVVTDPLLLPRSVLAGLVTSAAVLSLVSLYLIGKRQQRNLTAEVGADSARASGTGGRRRRR